ncbi:MAG: ATP phosphoribosyltransferase [Clostridia bacterium]|nr:ATP phosphoribosyltransferase [Clostridia bacterium]
MLTIALPKGRLARHAAKLFAACGVQTADILEDSRRLVFTDPATDIRFLLVKPGDVPVYVHRGTADMGVAGKDTLLEAGLPLYEMLDLRCGRCRMCVASCGSESGRPAGQALRVATKYPRIAGMYYGDREEDIEIIKLHGSIELAPVVGLSDVIVDIVESGSTIRENGLQITAEVMDISARLVVNRVSLKAKRGQITPLIEKLREAVRTQEC